MPDHQLPVSVYFRWEWWEQHYQAARGRPERVDLDWLDTTYLGRQRFLFEQFGQFGVGRERPQLDSAFLSKVIVFNCLAIPATLGIRLVPKQVGGYDWRPLSREQVAQLRPADMADTPFGERLVRERDLRLARYGVVTHLTDLGSAANNAFGIRGQEFYADLIADPGLAHGYLEVLTETMRLGYRFVSQLFGPIEGFPLGNCNVVMMSPRLYVKMLRPYDIAIVEAAAALTGQPPLCDLHHCNVTVDRFVEAYAAIPGLRSLQASHLSDIALVRATLPGVAFSAMVNPVDLLKKPAGQIEAELDRCVGAGARDLAIWDLDPAFGPDRVRDLLARVERVAARHSRRAAVSVIPITWEEMGWEFPQYQAGLA